MKKLLVLLMIIMQPIVASADKVEVNGIWYDIIKKVKEAHVTYGNWKISSYVGDDSFYKNDNRYSGIIIIPSEIKYDGETYNVNTIDAYTFSNCIRLTSITIPNNVTNIGQNAFENCIGLTSISLPNSIKKIESNVFSNAGLTSFVIPNSVTTIGECAFYRCDKLSSISIPDNVKVIEKYAFSGSGLISITIPNSVSDYGSSIFYDCPALASVNIEDGVSRIESGCFMYCSALTSITLPNSVKTIGQNAFGHCSSLTSITIPNSIETIEKWAFRYSGLNTIKIPNSVKTIGESVFDYCSELTNIEVDNENLYYCSDNGALLDKNKNVIIKYPPKKQAKTYNIPESVKFINSHAFQGCSSLESITIPSCLETIEEYVFSDCTGLTTISIPNSVKSIEQHAFSGCSKITSITIGSGVQSIGRLAFSNCLEIMDVFCLAEIVPNTEFGDVFRDSDINYATLHVPATSVETYMATFPWNQFKEIVALDGSITESPKCNKPIIKYENGQIKFYCETEGAEFVSEITDTDVQKYYDATISLTATYNICVYATKVGYDNSEAVTATLCWIDVEPKTEGITNGVANVRALPLLIQTNGSTMTVSGADDGTPVTVYSINGTETGSAISQNGAATIPTKLQSGSAAIVKVGDKSVKVVVK